MLITEKVEKKPMVKKKYQRVINRRKELSQIGKDFFNSVTREEFFKKEQTLRDMEMSCIDHIFECEGFKTYEKIAEFAKKAGAERVIDIGCAYGHQSEVFLMKGYHTLA